MRVKKWFVGLFDSNSSVSSKRVGGLCLILWVILIGTYYVWEIQHGGEESATSISIIEFSLISGVGLLGGGTVAEGFKNKFNSNEKRVEK